MRFLVAFFLSILTTANALAAAYKRADVIPPSASECKVGTGYYKALIGYGDARQPLTVVTKQPAELLSRDWVAADLFNVPYAYTSPSQLTLYSKQPKNKPAYAEVLRLPTINAFIAMSAEAGRAGIPLKIHSGFRAYDTQCGTFNHKMELEFFMDPKLVRTSPIDEDHVIQSVNTRSAFPGASEHQLGTAIDIVTNTPGKEWLLEPEMDQTSGFAWLQANAYKFGFVLSYPKGPLGPKSVNARTGYVYEPWHWRYIGVVPADRYHTCLIANGMTTQEFLRALNENPQFMCAQPTNLIQNP